MPERGTLKRARRARRAGKSPSTQAGEFVREEIHHVREGKHGAASAKQAIAIGLSKARRAGVDLPPPKTGSARTRKQAKRESAAGKRGRAYRSPAADRRRRCAGSGERGVRLPAIWRCPVRRRRPRVAVARAKADSGVSIDWLIDLSIY